jgi:hypothetical protein
MRSLLAVLLLAPALSAVPARAGLFGRSKVDSLWTPKPMRVDADDSDWTDSSAYEEDGLAVLAMNDASDLYLLVTAHTRESRDQLSGESHQDVSLWFIAADGKTRRWGARIPFSHRASVTNALRDPAGLDPEPEYLQYQGAEISTATLPGDVLDRLSSAGRRPIWEIKIPLKRLELNPDGAAAVDFVVSAPPGGAKRRVVPQTVVPTDPSAEGGRRARARREEGGSREVVWDAASYSLSVRLAPDPSAPKR